MVGGAATSYLTDRGISAAAIRQFKLGFSGDTGDYRRHRLVIPYLTPAGPWYLKFRCIAPHKNCKDFGHEKYYAEEGAEPHLFNAGALSTATVAVGVEGELNSIAGTMTGFGHVGIPGTGTWMKNPHWVHVFDSLDEFVFVADGDVPKDGEKKGVGEKLADTVCRALRNAYPDMTVRKVLMPKGHDTNSFVAEHGDIAYLEKLELI